MWAGSSTFLGDAVDNKTIAGVLIAVVLGIAQWGLTRAVNDMDAKIASMDARAERYHLQVSAIELRMADMANRKDLDGIKDTLGAIHERLAELTANVGHMQQYARRASR